MVPLLGMLRHPRMVFRGSLEEMVSAVYRRFCPSMSYSGKSRCPCFEDFPYVILSSMSILRMIRAHQLLHQFPDLLLIFIGCLHQYLQLFQKGVHLKGDRAADVDQVVVGLSEAFLRHQLLLIQLLPRAQAGVLDLDIYIRLIAGEADEVSGQGVDADRASHVQDEDLSAMGVGAGQKDETYGLRDRHEVPDDVRVGDGHRAAFGDLLFKDRDDRAVAAKDIPEADGHKLGLNILKYAAGAVLVRVFLPDVGEELRDL